jgi:hypothetical protein
LPQAIRRTKAIAAKSMSSAERKEDPTNTDYSDRAIAYQPSLVSG